ncbi:exodeoxyribonuclease VII large subunit [Demequina salsinemoris]|uniref:exodeoxyribonuclease VII large subunit n=1 Tax=Demequina salsinemoris TaxID=577470 RepID=UPI000A4DC967|nr:exodeoxyribonuclease VII large subunit [Demequina salsinemoris]
MSDADGFPGDNEPEPVMLPGTAAETSPERPWPVRHLSPKIGEYVSRMSPVWVEGQVLGVKRWRDLVFLTLRDTDENMSLGATLPAKAVEELGTPLEDGARIVVHAKPQWWTKSGSLQMRGREVRAVGLGDLLARLEMLKTALAEEGLFSPDRKVPLPFVPHVVGLVCATQGDAEHDVVENAQRRWPAVSFEIRRVTVQGPRAVPEVVAAMRELDARDEVDVIVVARGGGAFEDLLPFSDEEMVRAASRIVTPLVSAIGHEKDSPLLDLVADYRASTPTDAGKRIVPDAAQERQGVHRALATMRGSLLARVEREERGLSTFRTRPVMAHPARMLDPHRARLDTLHHACGRALVDILSTADARARELSASLRALSPQSTLDRGYAVVRDAEGQVVRDASVLDPGDQVLVRVAQGAFIAEVEALEGEDPDLY